MSCSSSSSYKDVSTYFFFFLVCKWIQIFDRVFFVFVRGASGFVFRGNAVYKRVQKKKGLRYGGWVVVVFKIVF